MTRIFFIICFLTSFISCKNPIKAPSENRGLITQKAMVVSARQEASKIGSDILEKGGNVFDAMMATEMALAVCYPYAGDRKSTRLNSSHVRISYAVFCLKKKNK